MCLLTSNFFSRASLQNLQLTNLTTVLDLPNGCQSLISDLEIMIFNWVYTDIQAGYPSLRLVSHKFKCCSSVYIVPVYLKLFAIQIVSRFSHFIWNLKFSSLLGTNLDLFCVRESDAAPFCKIYTKFYVEAKHLEKELNREWWDFWCPFV